MPSARIPLSRKAQHQRWMYLTIALIPLVGSFMLNLGLHLPFLNCPLLRYIGIPCPGWGLTRLFMAIARGDWAGVLHYHLLGPLFFIGFLIALIHVSWELIQNRHFRSWYSPLVENPKFYIGCFLVLWGYHGTRLQTLWQSGELSHTIQNSLLGPWLFMS